MSETDKPNISGPYAEATEAGYAAALGFYTSNPAEQHDAIKNLQALAKDNPHAARACIFQLVRMAEYSNPALDAVVDVAVKSGLEAVAIMDISRDHSNIRGDGTRIATDIALTSGKEDAAQLALKYISEKNVYAYADAAARLGTQHPTLAPIAIKALAEEIRSARTDPEEGKTRLRLSNYHLREMVDTIASAADKGTYDFAHSEKFRWNMKSAMAVAREAVPASVNAIDRILGHIAKADAAAPKPGGPDKP